MSFNEDTRKAIIIKKYIMLKTKRTVTVICACCFKKNYNPPKQFFSSRKPFK